MRAYIGVLVASLALAGCGDNQRNFDAPASAGGGGTDGNSNTSASAGGGSTDPEIATSANAGGGSNVCVFGKSKIGDCALAP
jgi:hypothetical protein